MRDRGDKVGGETRVEHEWDGAGTMPTPGKQTQVQRALVPTTATAPKEAAPVVPTAPIPELPHYSSIQRIFGDRVPAKAGAPEVHTAAAQGISGPAGPLPHLEQIQRSFGAHDVRHVQAHIGPEAKAGAQAMGAEAFATGDHVVFAGAPSLHIAAHEAAHVVQQRAGVHLSGGVGKLGDTYEQHADAVADAVVRGESAEALLGAATPRGSSSTTIQRKGAVFQSGAALEAMSLTQFDAYARTQADWSTGPAVGADKDKLWSLLEQARANEAFLAGCGPMKVSGLLAAVADAKTRLALESYCAAVHKDRPTVEIEPVSSIPEAVKMGEALPKLEATPGGATIKVVIKQQAGNTQLEDMIAKNAIDPFIKYVQTCHPVLQANDGAEISSFLAMQREGVDPSGYKPKVPRIRNLHRFQKAALDALAHHETDTSKTKPLTLILHSAMDHNGAFHRDPNVTAVARHPKNVTIMIEGKETLAEIQGELDPLAKKYGRGDKIDQVMFAGHGNARLMEMAGTLQEDKGAVKETTENIDLDGNKAKTEALFEELMKHMDPASPNHRVIFNACLTNSNAVPGKLDPDPIKAQQQIKDSLAKNASLATSFREMAKAKGLDLDSKGANASIGEIGLIDNRTGALDLVSTEDPEVTAPKIKYVELGEEPEGVMRAVVEEWALDKKGCLDAIDRRQSRGAPGHWDGDFIYAMLDVINNGHRDDAALMNVFASGAGYIAEAKFEDECRVRAVGRGIPDAWIPKIYGALQKTSEWKAERFIPLVFFQVWARTDATKAAAFRDHLGAHFTCHSAARFVDIDYLAAAGLLDGLLPLPPAAAPPPGELMLALVDVAQRRDNAQARCIGYLQALLGTERWFPAALGIAGKLSGLATENEILIAIDRAKPSGAKAPDPNIDIDRDGTNDSYVEPLTKTGTVDVPSSDVFEKPDSASTKLGTLAKGTSVRIIGRSGATWYAIEHNHRTAFVHLIDVAA